MPFPCRFVYFRGGVGGPKRPERLVGGGEVGSGAAGVATTGAGERSVFGLHCAHAGILGRGGSRGGTADDAGTADGISFAIAFSFLSARLCTVRHAGRAGAGGPSSIGGRGGGGGGGAPKPGGSWGGCHSGEYSPPAPCLDLTLMSSAISYCSARRSSLSFPTSASRIRTSLASALLKSLIYLGGFPLKFLLDIGYKNTNKVGYQ